jgi:hypothetical protein
MSFDLGLTGEGGGQYIRYNASTGTWNVDGEQIQLGQFLVDPTSLKTGWGKIVAGSSPSWSWDTRPGVKGDQPSDEHKRGFSLQMYSKTIGQREWSTNSAGSNKGLSAIWGQISDQAVANPGKVPVLKFTGATVIAIGKGSTQVPNFTLEKWVDAPADFALYDPRGFTQEQTSKPAPAKAPAPAASDDEF